MHIPPWFQSAVKEIGTREQPNNTGPAIARYIKLAKCGSQRDPWCAIFVNAMLELNGVTGSKSAAALSFSRKPKFAKLKGPSPGAITVFWRGSRASGLGHVGFCNGIIGDYVSVIGGNQSDMVREEMFQMTARKQFGLHGFYWPSAIELPTVGNFKPIVAHGTKGGTGKVV